VRTPGGRPGVFVQTPKSDIFVAMLSIALGAIVLGCLLLILLLNRYNFQLKAAMTPDNRPALARLPADSLQSEFFRLYTCNLAGDSLEYSRPLELVGIDRFGRTVARHIVVELPSGHAALRRAVRALRRA
jgi:hypothetical protein